MQKQINFNLFSLKRKKHESTDIEADLTGLCLLNQQITATVPIEMSGRRTAERGTTLQVMRYQA